MVREIRELWKIPYMKYDSSSNSYTKEFKRNVVAVLKRGMKLIDEARRLSISKSTLFCRRLVRGDDGFRRKTSILEGTVIQGENSC